jgi:hypothetical protein
MIYPGDRKRKKGKGSGTAARQIASISHDYTYQPDERSSASFLKIDPFSQAIKPHRHPLSTSQALNNPYQKLAKQPIYPNLHDGVRHQSMG